jgi:uncharacterized RDD family membrane protein YckC
MKLRPFVTLALVAVLGIAGMARAQSSWDADPHANSGELVGIGHDTTLPAGHEAKSVVSIMGTTRIAGHDHTDAVAVLGDTLVDGRVDGAVVAVIGDVRLGPTAEVGGDVVTLLGTLQRDPAAIVHGDIHSIFDRNDEPLSSLQAWIKHCVFYGRPLAFAAGLSWAWGLALTVLVLYALLALLLPGAMRHCVRTFDEYPGHALLAAFIGILLTPVTFLLLLITVIGIPTIPFVATGLACAGLFGRAVILAWIGSRILGLGTLNRESVGFLPLAVLIGGAVMLLLYTIPVLGFLAFQLLGILGFGAVIYAIIQSLRAHRRVSRPAEPPPARETFPEPPAGATATASAAAPAATLPVSPDLPRAGFWIRMAALFLDAVLIGFITSLMHHAFLALLAIYGAVMWKLRGATLGGIIFDLKVVRLDGRPINWETAIVRALGCFLSLAVAGLGFIWIAFDDAKQAWHDKIAGTVVVRVPKVAAIS